jgi:hypothetical protein
MGVFGRMAQACQLLDKAICLRQQEAPMRQGMLDDETKQLDLDTQRLLGVLIDQNDGTLCGDCEASAIVIA